MSTVPAYAVRFDLPAFASRLEGWESRLQRVIDAAREKPYQLGEHDCVRFACQAIHALTGADLWPDVAGYSTRQGAALRIARIAGTRALSGGQNALGDYRSAADRFLGCPSVDVRFARRGDICCVRTVDQQEHFGVCLGADVALLAPEGLVFTPTLTCVCAWRIG